MRGAVRAARAYLMGELYGEGTISFFADGDFSQPIREDERSIFTNFKMITK